MVFVECGFVLFLSFFVGSLYVSHPNWKVIIFFHGFINLNLCLFLDFLSFFEIIWLVEKPCSFIDHFCLLYMPLFVHKEQQSSRLVRLI